jgi:redox-sensitive bicupin YhaK (pirin superfamily)
MCDPAGSAGTGEATMSNLDTHPVETTAAPASPPAPAGPAAVQILEPRQVPLGGPRAMTVRRTLPQRQRSLIGGWCFLDHYGPDPVAGTGGMQVPPHPHTGLQTVSWLFTGEIEHRDSAGHHAYVRPGELNLMTAGRGISHSEVSTPGTTMLHGAQLWVALPSGARFTAPGFERYVPEPVDGEGFTARVFLGSLLGQSSPAVTYSPLVGAEISIAAGGVVAIEADPAFEYGVLVDTGVVAVNGTPVETAHLAYLAPGAPAVELRADAAARVLLLGGRPLGEQIVMWWNFIGRSHDEIAAYRAAWQASISAEAAPPEGERFALPVDDPLPPIPAPALPNVTLRPRG